jgi:type IV pilus assembly protein PilY1
MELPMNASTEIRQAAATMPFAPISAPSRIVIALTLAFATMTAQSAPVDIAQAPVYLGGTLAPNVMFIIDDSGSMAWDCMPGAGSDCSFRGDDGVTYRIDGRWMDTSSFHNKIYYNPDVTYDVPPKADGSARTPYSFTAASRDGYQNGTLVNLTGYTYRKYDATRSGCAVFDNTTKYSQTCFPSITVSSTSGPGGTDERQNFANWYSFYRTRGMTAKAGISIAFNSVGEGMRVGYGQINGGSITIDGAPTTTRVLKRGVRDFADYNENNVYTGQRNQFFSWLFDVDFNNSTPLRRALEAAGEYYERADDKGPWSTTPGQSGGENLSCRQSYTIMMTDGYWNGSSAYSPHNQDWDSRTGPTITGPNGQTYTYTPIGPYKDGDGVARSDTLADVAMYYWVNDLVPALTNDVPVNNEDPAFWQHMVSFTIGLGVEGQINPTDAENAIRTGTTIAWPTVVSNTASTIDDLLHAGINGHGGFYSANDSVAFATALRDTLSTIAARQSSASAVAANVARIDTNALVFQGLFDSTDWSGDIRAYKIDENTGAPAATPLWSAESGIPNAGGRNIYTWNGTNGIPFTWTDLTATQKSSLVSNTYVPGATGDQVLAWVRGDKTNEAGRGANLFRARNTRLGDIINSDPVILGKTDFGYGSAASLSAAERTAYANRKASSAYVNRPNVLFVGANDGMMHAFDASYSVTPPVNGNLNELFAYVPNDIIQYLPFLASKDYTHRYYVDAPAAIADAIVGSTWKSVLVGATGAGGQSYFALDVEDPASFSSTKVMWEFTHAELGTTVGTASIVRTENGKWVAIFGNGYNSTSQKAQLFVVDVQTGALLKVIDTGVGSAISPNGLTTPVAVDTDRNGSADLVYAGDYQGNVWKFDFFSTAGGTPWTVAYNGKPLFNAYYRDPNTGVVVPQPITVKPTVGRHPSGGTMVYFGTGQLLETGSNADMSVQSFYAIRDECGARTCSASGATAVTKTQLLKQTIDQEIYGENFTDGNGNVTGTYDVRVFSENVMGATQKGFYLDLISPAVGIQGERVVSPALLWDDRIIFASAIPSDDPCGFGGESWLIELDPFSGARTTFSVFDLNNDGLFNSSDKTNGGNGDVANGRRFKDGMIKTPGVVRSKDGTKGYKYVSDSSGSLSKADNPLNGSFGRQSWRQVK